MITDLKSFENLFKLACEWVINQEKRILNEGITLDDDQQIDAYLIGIKNIQKVRLMSVSEMPKPNHKELQPALEATGLLSSSTIGVCYRYGIYIKEEYINERRLIVHELTHTLQYERFGSIDAFLKQYLQECLTVGYFNSPLEQEAQEMENKILKH